MQAGRMRVERHEGESAMNARAMSRLDDDAYKTYLVSSSIFFDHRCILRAGHGAYPIAVNARQVDLLIEVLEWYKTSMR